MFIFVIEPIVNVVNVLSIDSNMCFRLACNSLQIVESLRY